MADNNEKGRINVDNFDFANEGASEETPILVNYLITRLQQAMENPALQGEVQQQLHAHGFIPFHQDERILEKSLGETSKRGISKVKQAQKVQRGRKEHLIQQFDAAFGDEGFTESSKLCHVAMHFQNSAKQWWASLRANGEAPQTWKNLRASIMKQFLSSDAKDKVLTKWQSLKLTPFKSIHKYVAKFWDLHLKATVYKMIDFEEQKQQFCVGLPEDMNEYVNSQRPKTISVVIHHTMVAARINFQQGAKRNLKPMETKEKHEHKGKNQPQNSSKGNSSNNKAKQKGVYKGKNRLTPEELERYRKDNRCFKCGEQGHACRACPQRNAHNEQPRASIIEATKEDVHCKGSPLSYAWGKVREHEAFILFDPGSTHNFISHELVAKVGNHWLIHNAFHVSLLKPYKGEPPSEAITEDPPEVEDQEEVLQPESILRHEDKVLRHGKTIRRYLIKFKNYPFEDAIWMQGIQLKDNMHLVNAYNDSLE
ncbi:hypothetical protein L7F22_022970 [Adiantum nelumboides]|nr:hypothetical protein [Adiantum nelumboides]